MGRPWDFGKGFDHSAPCAPIHRVSEVGHPEKGRIWLSVNGAVKQDGDLAELIWPIPDVISILSRSMRLEPGDLIFSGTPAGVGAVKPGDKLEGGVIAQRVVVEKLLPIRKLGSHEITAAEEMTEEQKEAAARAAVTAGVSLYEPEADVIESEAKKFGTAEVDYIFDQSPQRLLRHLMPRYVTTQLFHALLESVASEHAARMTAMDAATNNAGEMIDAYTLQMNRVRQAAITKEIIEIVSGAAAL